MEIPWYDSDWLQIYNRARFFIAEVEPQQLAAFEEAFQALSPPAGFNTRELKHFFDAGLRDELKALIAGLDESELEDHELLTFGRRIVHNHKRFNELQLQLTDTVSDLCGERVEPCYNFLSLYNNLGVCEPHLDSPYAKWTLDVCIEQSSPWPIYISNPESIPDMDSISPNWAEELLSGTSFNRYCAEPGDALLFSGSHQWHYRERIPRDYQQNYCHLIFFHFIPVAQKALLDPRQWPELLKLPVLENLSREFESFYKDSMWESNNPFNHT